MKFNPTILAIVFLFLLSANNYVVSSTGRVKEMINENANYFKNFFYKLAIMAPEDNAELCAKNYECILYKNNKDLIKKVARITDRFDILIIKFKPNLSERDERILFKISLNQKVPIIGFINYNKVFYGSPIYIINGKIHKNEKLINYFDIDNKNEQ